MSRKLVTVKYALCVLITAYSLIGWAADDAAKPTAAKQVKFDPAAAYQQYCAACHGKNMQGASATPLVKNDWLYGRVRLTIAKNILYGIEGTDMPAWGRVLTQAQAFALAAYIIDAQDSLVEVATNIPETLASKDYQLDIEIIGKGELEIPWGIEFISEDLALITERTGALRWMRKGVIDPKPIAGMPKPYLGTVTGGLMDIALDPNYRDNGWVYLAISFSEGEQKDRDAPAMTRVIRGKVKDYRWTEEQILFDVGKDLRVSRGDRWGSRFAWDTEGRLLFSIGDMNDWNYAQDLGAAAGKIYRINPDGSIPHDNPFVDNPNALPALYAYGTRNVQGMDRHPDTGVIWFTDHGPMGGDELNVLKKGANFGWPVITYGIDYTGETISETTHKEGMEQPVTQWTPSKAVAPATFVVGELFPKWKNRLLVGSLGFEELWLYTLNNDKIVAEEKLFRGYGRIRDLKFGPDGALYVALNNPDLILRITPKAPLN